MGGKACHPAAFFPKSLGNVLNIKITVKCRTLTSVTSKLKILLISLSSFHFWYLFRTITILLWLTRSRDTAREWDLDHSRTRCNMTILKHLPWNRPKNPSASKPPFIPLFCHKKFSFKIRKRNKKTKLQMTTEESTESYPIRLQHKQSQCWGLRRRFSWFCRGFSNHEEEASRIRPGQRSKRQRRESHTESVNKIENNFAFLFLFQLFAITNTNFSFVDVHYNFARRKTFSGEQMDTI